MLKFGIDRAAEFAPLFAGRVALITAPSGRSSDNVGSIDVLRQNFDLRLLLAPEHGVRGDMPAGALFDGGVDRVILGTAAVHDEAFLCRALETYGEKIAVGVDIADGRVATHGWTQTSRYSCEAFFEKLQQLGVKTIICTDISRDGAMRGTNRALYGALSARYCVDIIASGGVSSLDDIRALRALNLYGAIIGKAYYTGAVDLKEAIGVAK